MQTPIAQHNGSAAELAPTQPPAASRKTWRTPKVIEATLTQTAGGPYQNEGYGQGHYS